MATSGTVTNFSPTRTEIITQAALDNGAATAGIAMSSEAMSNFNFMLNAMLAQWSVMGIKVWTVKEAILFPTSGQRRYTIGHATDANNAYCADASDLVETALAVAGVATDTTITVDSDTGIEDNDKIAIFLDSGDFHFTTVNGAPAADVVTIDDALPSAAAVDAKVYAFTSNISKPIRITDARRVAISDGRRVPFVNMYARRDFMELPDPVSTGTPYAPYYDRQTVAGYLDLIPPPAAPLTDLIGFTWHRGIEDMVSASDTPDLPKEWVNCIVTNLAKRALVRYPNQIRQALIISNADEAMAAMSGVDREEESVFFQPEPAGADMGGPWGSY